MDISQSSIRIAQIKKPRLGKPSVTAYGYTQLSGDSIMNGEIIKPEAVAEAVKTLLAKQIVGKISTRRVAVSVPIAQTYTRILSLPKMNRDDLINAINLEAEQYIPLPINDLYIEHVVLQDLGKSEDSRHEILMVAMPKRIIASYLKLFEILELETFNIEPSISSIMRAVQFTRKSNKPKIVIDFGATSSDFAIHDGHTIRLTSTIETGSDQTVNMIAKHLKVTDEQAHHIKTYFGIGKSRWQEKVVEALHPVLDQLTDEVQKLIRYYQDRDSRNQPLQEIAIVGGGANLSGLDNFLHQLTGIETYVSNPWEKLEVSPLQPPHNLEAMMYLTSIGLALLELERE